MKKLQIVIIFSLFLLTIIFPVILVWYFTGQDYVFGGLIANPIDGQSYLAKMIEGVNGAFLAHLPYTPNSGSGQPIFLLYIGLGHLSRLLNIPVIIVYHMARILCAAFLFWSLTVLINKCIQPAHFSKTLIWLCFGSGMGWILAPIGNIIPIDFYVAEMYPFLASYTNPHFPLGLGILIWIFIYGIEYKQKKDLVIIFSLGLLLSAILQFGVVIALGCLGGLYVWNSIQRIKTSPFPFLAISAGGGVWLVYQFFLIRKDPILSIWDRQNVTPSPDVLWLIGGLAPLIFAAIPGLFLLRKKAISPYLKMFLIWMVFGLFLTYFPFNLQRRFLTGLYIPLVFIFIFGFENWHVNIRWKNVLYRSLLFLSIVSNIIVLIMGVSILNNKNSISFLKGTEYQSLIWVKDHSQNEDVVLASPELSLYIPTIAERQVVYGHPYETIYADQKKIQVNNFYEGKLSADDRRAFMTQNNIKYIILGPRERQLGTIPVDPGWKTVYSNEDVRVYETQS